MRQGTVELVDLGAWSARLAEGFRSGRLGQFSESCCETQTCTAGVNAEFVVSAVQVLNKTWSRITFDAVRSVRNPRIVSFVL